MRLFSHLHKSSFWSQFVLGMVAIFALPAVQANANAELRAEINQSISQIQQEIVGQTEIAATQIFHPQQNSLTSGQKSPKFCKFSIKLDRLLAFAQPPIRAGPLSI